MKKYVILFFVLIMTTGCRVEYNLYVDEKKITEDITLVSENENDNVSIKKFIEPIPAFYDTLIDSESFVKKTGIEYYHDKKVNSGAFTNYNLKYDFDYYNFKKSKILNNEVSLFKFTQKNGVYYIETGAKIYAFDEYNKMSNLIINVHFSDNIDIVSSNAHQKDHNNLSWIITENYNPISIAYKIKNNNSEYKNNTNNDLNPSVNKTDDNKSNTIKVSLKNDRNSLILVGLLFTLFLILIFIVIKFRWKRK